jgi:AraC-like DNA-binding protein
MAVPDPGERIAYLRAPALPGMELLAVENSYRAWHVFHERYAICACAAAEAKWRYAGSHYRSGDHDIMLLEPGETHRNTSIGKANYFKVAMIPVELLMESAGEIGARRAPHFVSPAAAGLGNGLFEAVYRLGQAIETSASPLEQQSRFAVLVHRLLQQARPRPAQGSFSNARAAVERARRHLLARLNETVTLDELAGLVRLSRFHLVHSFTRQYGLPPHAFQTLIRCERARALLGAGMPASEAAAAVGFADQSHLTRHFKRVWHVTPGQYLRSGPWRAAPTTRMSGTLTG